jgi:hypothetical protein
MEHKLVDTGWETVEELQKLIKTEEADGCNVVAMGRILGADVLVLTKRDKKFEHEVIPVEVETRDQLNMVLAEKIAQGCKICAIGECQGNPIIIVKKTI